MTRVIAAVLAVAVAAVVVVLQDGGGDVASDYDPLRHRIDYEAPDGWAAQGRIDMVNEQADDYEPGDGVTGL